MGLKCFTDTFTISWAKMFHVKHYIVFVQFTYKNVSRETLTD